MITIALTWALIAQKPMSIAPNYSESLQQWRAEKDAQLRKPEGWLSLAGLLWISEGENKVGSADSAEILLPKTESPDSVGILVRTGDKFRFKSNGKLKVLADGVESKEFDILPDSAEKPTKVQIGNLVFVVIHRGSKYGVRLWNPNSEVRSSFTGRKWFAPAEKWVIKAKFTPYDPPQKVDILNVLGDLEPSIFPGYVTFDWEGKTHRLEAEKSGEGLFINFKDLSNGKETYGAGRFLNTPKPVDGFVELDFNKAVSPPCSFTDFATCPLPPKENRLQIRVDAGEKAYRAH